MNLIIATSLIFLLSLMTVIIVTNRNINQTIKNFLFANYRYHICIENCDDENYFTEKIIDALLTKTVPIYWGATDIGKFFDPKGILSFNSIEDFFEIINNINEITYEQLKPYIEKNYILAQEYGRSIFDRIKETVEKEKK